MEEIRAMGNSFDLDKAAGRSAQAAGVVAPAEEGTDAEQAPADVATAEPSSLTLVPPAPPAPVEESQAGGAIKLDATTVAKLDVMVADFVVAITKLDTQDPKFEARMADIRKLGDDDIKAAAQVSSRLLDRPIGSLTKGGSASSASVGNSLLALRKQIDALDPSHQGELFGPRKLLGIIPFGDRLRAYFGKYQSSQSHINAVVAGLQRGQTELARDNDDLEREKANLWQTMERLRQYLYLAQKLDSSVTERVDKIETTDPERARILKEDMLFYVRQKVQDLTAELAVAVQGYLSIDVIRRNNTELIRGVDRATTTTISALRTAVIVAQALGDQKLVLDQITALNETTSSLIEGTSAMLRTQSAAINEQASSSTVDIEKLQAAFDNVYATMDEIDAYKLKSIDAMAKTAATITAQINKAQPYLDRARATDEGNPATAAIEGPKGRHY
jgi:uncharacterized protein YaaN involved in tellurite resistance